MTESALQNCMSQFKIGDPIKTLFNPVFFADPDYESECIKLKLNLQAPDANGVRGIIKVTLQEDFPMMDFKREPRSLHKLMRYMLHKMLMHEADESISICGVKEFDPHV